MPRIGSMTSLALYPAAAPCTRASTASALSSAHTYNIYSAACSTMSSADLIDSRDELHELERRETSHPEGVLDGLQRVGSLDLLKEEQVLMRLDALVQQHLDVVLAQRDGREERSYARGVIVRWRWRRHLCFGFFCRFHPLVDGLSRTQLLRRVPSYRRLLPFRHKCVRVRGNRASRISFLRGGGEHANDIFG
ncbi:hypothetical protein BC834DRAFT_893115 [Gloeopeniophorella convolvens]|nr:hypothetical protein BC834DRAFT_893115 [Gloeopeniophorella convolvens]